MPVKHKIGKSSLLGGIVILLVLVSYASGAEIQLQDTVALDLSISASQSLVESAIEDSIKAAVNTLMTNYTEQAKTLGKEGAQNKIIYPMLQSSDNRMRREILSRPFVWQALRFGNEVELWFFWLAVSITVVMMIVFAWFKSPWENQAQEHIEKGNPTELNTGFIQLLAQDFAPVAFDVHLGSFEAHLYRGFIHWLRDATEKSLSFVLLLAFYFYLAKAGGYFWDYLQGETWRLIFIPLDINIALAMAGWALIIDGFIMISAMVDAPGVSRTLDSLIVIIAGFIVMLVEASPGEDTLVRFSVGTPPWLAPMLIALIALLFSTRVGVLYWRYKALKEADGV